MVSAGVSEERVRERLGTPGGRGGRSQGDDVIEIFEREEIERSLS